MEALSCSVPNNAPCLIMPEVSHTCCSLVGYKLTFFFFQMLRCFVYKNYEWSLKFYINSRLVLTTEMRFYQFSRTDCNTSSNFECF